MKKPGKMVSEVLSHILKKPATVKYPFAKFKFPDRFRGKISFVSEKCIGCKLCVRDCPANAIEIRKVGEKKFEAVIDNGKCIYCAQCVEVCPKKALEATGDFELAQLDKTKLKSTFHAKPGEPTEKKAE